MRMLVTQIGLGLLILASSAALIAEPSERCLYYDSCFIKETADKVLIGDSQYFTEVYKKENNYWQCFTSGLGVGGQIKSLSYVRYCLHLDGSLTARTYKKLGGVFLRHGEGVSFSSDGSLSSEGVWKEGDFYLAQETKFNKGYDYYRAKYFADCLKGNCDTGIGVGWVNEYTLAWGSWVRGVPISGTDQLVFANFKKYVKEHGSAAVQNEFAKSLSSMCIRGDCENGYGVQHLGKTGKYWGFFRSGLPHGAGKFEDEKEAYVGYFLEGLYHGEGTLTIAKKDYVYEGEFVAGKRHGAGFATYGGVGIYKGNFFLDQRSGFGEFIWNDGDRFEGQWSNGERVEGIWTSSDGEIYEGEYQNNLRHGRGKLTLKNGRTVEGLFQKGELVKHESDKWQTESSMGNPWQ